MQYIIFDIVKLDGLCFVAGPLSNHPIFHSKAAATTPLPLFTDPSTMSPKKISPNE